VLLRQLTGEEDVVVSSAGGRPAVLGGVNLIGDCSNLLALRLQLNGGQFADFLSAVKTAVL